MLLLTSSLLAVLSASSDAPVGALSCSLRARRRVAFSCSFLHPNRPPSTGLRWIRRPSRSRTSSRAAALYPPPPTLKLLHPLPNLSSKSNFQLRTNLGTVASLSHRRLDVIQIQPIHHEPEHAGCWLRYLPRPTRSIKEPWCLLASGCFVASALTTGDTSLGGSFTKRLRAISMMGSISGLLRVA